MFTHECVLSFSNMNSPAKVRYEVWGEGFESHALRCLHPPLHSGGVEALHFPFRCQLFHARREGHTRDDGLILLCFVCNHVWAIIVAYVNVPLMKGSGKCQ